METAYEVAAKKAIATHGDDWRGWRNACRHEMMVQAAGKTAALNNVINSPAMAALLGSILGTRTSSIRGGRQALQKAIVGNAPVEINRQTRDELMPLLAVTLLCQTPGSQWAIKRWAFCPTSNSKIRKLASLAGCGAGFRLMALNSSGAG